MFFTEQEISEHRADAEAMMLDQFQAFAPSGVTKNEKNMEVPGYDDRGAVAGWVTGGSDTTRETTTRTVRIGTVEVPVERGGIRISVTADVPAGGEYGAGWEYQLVTPGPATDPALTGTRWLVVDVAMSSYASSRRLDVARIPPQS